MPTSDDNIEFNHHDLETMQDPYPLYAAVRGKCPVAHSNNLGGFFYAVGYDSTKQVLSDYRHFSSTSGVALPSPASQMLPVDLDPPLQTKYRKILNKFFSVEAAEANRSRVEDIVNHLIDGFIEAGNADIAAQLTRPTLSGVMLPLIGVPTDDITTLSEALEFSAHYRLSDPAEYERKNQFIAGNLMSLAATRRGAAPRHDFLQYLIDSEIDGRHLNDEEIFRVLLVTLFGALDTTHATLNEAIIHLSGTPADKAGLLSGAIPWPGAIEEFVRYASPIQVLRRTATMPVEFHGASLVAGDPILALNGAGNRDPEHFPEPDRCLLTRDARDHLGFGAGAHVCLGRNFARVMINVVLQTLLTRLPDFQIADDFVPEYASGEARGMKSLPVVFTPGRRTIGL